MKIYENKVLYIEDDLAERRSIEHEAREACYPFNLFMVSSVKEALELIGKNSFQAIVAEYDLIDGQLTDLISQFGSSPLIIITGEGNSATAVNAFKAGAYDYLIKDINLNYLKLLPITVAKSIEQKKQYDELQEYRNRLENLVQERTAELTDMYLQLRESVANFKNIFNNTSDCFIITDYNFKFLEANNTLLNYFGVTRDYLSSQALIDFLSPSYRPLIFNGLEKIKQGLPSGDMEIEVIAPVTGKLMPFEISNVPIMFNNINAILTVMRNIAERKSIARRLFETIIQTEEEERSRIARDLHDEIGPLISALKIYITSFSESKSVEKKNKLASQMGTIIHDVIEAIKEISNDMSPHVLVYFGLHAAVQSIVNLFSKNMKIHLQSGIGNLRFSGTVESVVYRIIKELINNTVKHANASDIYIELAYLHSALVCHYRDNGIGFEIKGQLPNEQERGMGISNIISRVKSLGGELAINTSPGNGFEIRLVIQTSILDHHDK